MIVVGGFNTSMDELIELDTLSLGEVQRARRATSYPGGKGLHVAAAIAALGEPVALVGLIDREHRALFEGWLRARGVVFHGIEIDGAIRHCFAIQEKSGRITEILEQGPEVPESLALRLTSTFRELAAQAPLAVLSGSLPRGLRDDTYADLVASLPSTRCIVDASGEPFRLAAGARPHMVKPNRDEAAKWLGRPIDSLPAAARAAQRLAGDGVARVVVSLGEDGAVSWGPGGELLHASVEIGPCANTVGSGDALVGGMAVGLLREWSSEAVLRLGVACGAANAMTRETGSFHREDVERLLPLVKVKPLG